MHSTSPPTFESRALRSVMTPREVETIAIPMLIVVNNLPWIGPEGFSVGWLNSYRVQIVPFISDGLTIFLFVQFFKDLPRELIEAARVEGASWFQIYRRVVMPLSLLSTSWM